MSAPRNTHQQSPPPTVNSEAVTKRDRVYFHGTDSDQFHEFKPTNAAKGNSHWNPLGEGLYVTDQKYFARMFGNNVLHVSIPSGASYKVVNKRLWLSVGENLIYKALAKAGGPKSKWDTPLMFKVELNRLLENRSPYETLYESTALVGEHYPYQLDRYYDELPKLSNSVFGKYDFVVFTETNDPIGHTDDKGVLKSAQEIVVYNPALQKALFRKPSINTMTSSKNKTNQNQKEVAVESIINRSINEHLSVLREDDGGGGDYGGDTGFSGYASDLGGGSGMGGGGGNTGFINGQGDLWNAFAQPFTDILQTGLYGVKTLATHTKHIIFQVLHSIPALLIPLWKADYKKWENAKVKELISIENQYAEVLNRNSQMMYDHDLWGFAFMMDPNLMLAGKVVQHLPGISQELLALVGIQASGMGAGGRHAKTGNGGGTSHFSFGDYGGGGGGGYDMGESVIIPNPDDKEDTERTVIFSEEVAAVAPSSPLPSSSSPPSPLPEPVVNKLRNHPAVAQMRQMALAAFVTQAARSMASKKGIGPLVLKRVPEFQELSKALKPEELSQTQNLATKESLQSLKDFYVGQLSQIAALMTDPKIKGEVTAAIEKIRALPIVTASQ